MMKNNIMKSKAIRLLPVLLFLYSCSSQPGSIEKAIEDLSSPKDEIKITAANTLARKEFRTSRAVDPLIKLLWAPNPKLRSAAVMALGDIRDQRALVSIIRMLKDKNTEVLLSTIEALRDLENSKAAPHLIKLFIKSKKAKVRYVIAITLGRLKGSEVMHEKIFDFLKDALNKDTSHSVRIGAAKGLEKLGDNRAVPLLKKALKTNDSKLRKAIRNSLEVLGSVVQDTLKK